MSQDIKSGPVMIRGGGDLPYINGVLTAHRVKNIVYRAGPARKVQLVVPSAPLPSPQSAVIRTLRPTIHRLNASLKVLAAKAWGKSEDTRAGLEATKAEDAEICHTGKRISSHVEQGEKNYFQSQSRVSDEEENSRKTLCPAGFDDKNSEDELCEDDSPIIVRTHRALCAADFDDTDDEDAFPDGGTRGFNLEASTRWSNCNNRLKSTRGPQLTTIQLRIKENMLKEIAQQAFKERENGENGCSIVSQPASEEDDWVLDMVLQLMDVGQTMMDAGGLQGDEGDDIQKMMRNNLETLLQKATRPFRPSGIRAGEAELFQCLEAFRQMRLKLQEGNPGKSMADILTERRLDLKPR